MTPKEVKSYILAHYQEQTCEQMARACDRTTTGMQALCRCLSIRAITGVQQKINVIKGAQGGKTVAELAELCNCTTITIWSICRQFGLAFAKAVKVSIEEEPVEEEDYKKWSPQRRQAELNKEIAEVMRQGFTRWEALAILEEFANYLTGIRIDSISSSVRPPAIYSNPTYTELLSQLLSS